MPASRNLGIKIALFASITVNIITVAILSVGVASGNSRGTSAVESRLQKKIAAADLPAGELNEAKQHDFHFDHVDKPQDIDSWIDFLRQNNASPRMIFAVASIMLDEKYFKRENSIRNPTGSPKWSSRYSGLDASQKDQIEQIRIEKDSELQLLLGEDYAFALLGGRNPVLGLESLDAKTMVQVLTVMNDFQAAIRGLKGKVSESELLEIELAQINDLTEVLTADQLLIFEAYNSREAKNLQRGLAGVSLTDDEYITIFQELKNSRVGGSECTDSENFQQNLKNVEVILGAVGPNDTVQYVSRSDPSFQPIIKSLEASSIGSREILKRYETWLNFYSEVGLIQAASQSRQETYSRGRLLAQETYNILTSGMTPMEIQKFSRSQTGVLLADFLKVGPNG